MALVNIGQEQENLFLIQKGIQRLTFLTTAAIANVHKAQNMSKIEKMMENVNAILNGQRFYKENI